GAQIDSDHVVQVLAAGVDEPRQLPWLVMELLHGDDLAAYIQREGAVSPAMVAAVFRQLAHPLSRAHEKGIVHRDLKPENIFLGRSRTDGVPFMVKILDYGIAAFVGAHGSIQTTSIGSPAWMAP